MGACVRTCVRACVRVKHLKNIYQYQFACLIDTRLIYFGGYALFVLSFVRAFVRACMCACCLLPLICYKFQLYPPRQSWW